MSKSSDKNHKIERPAVKTTIVGGRPPGSGRENSSIPRGIEVLVKKASVDPDFKKLLLEKRAEAAEQISLELTDSERSILKAVPAAQLEAIINNTSVSSEERRVFLGKAAAAMLAVLGYGVISSCGKTKGIQPDKVHHTKGIQPDEPEMDESVSKGIRPDYPQTNAEPLEPEIRMEATEGIRPDRPRRKKPEAPETSTKGGIRPDDPDDDEEL